LASTTVAAGGPNTLLRLIPITEPTFRFRSTAFREHAQPCARPGVADLHWLIPETIDRVEIFKGSYFPHLGDFATSGAINIVTRRYAQPSSLTVMGGSYQTARFLGILSTPEGATFRPYMAFEYYHNDGPFKNPAEYNR
jgi:outer membrane cobalamin receptor